MTRRILAAGALALALAAAGCGGGEGTAAPTPPPPPAPVATRVEVLAPVTALPVGRTTLLSALVRNQQGNPMTAPVTWQSAAPGVATVDAGGTVTGVAPGSAVITATAGSASGSVTFTVTGAPTYVAGQPVFGRNSYVEYVPGNAPVIITAPHGGALLPASIPERTASACGGSATIVQDVNTADLARQMQARFQAAHGTIPHLVIMHLHRRKVDANRTAPEAACGNAEAGAAMEDWHDFIDAAKAAVLRSHGKGWYIDLHGHGHALPRLELGYLLADADLNRPDAQLDAAPGYEQQSSIRTLSQASPLSFSALLRGPQSLGTLYADRGIAAIPSRVDPAPNGTDYFNGGDNTVRHACGSGATALGGATGGGICGVQIEAHFAGVRDTPASRERFGDVTAAVLEVYLRTHWGLSVKAP